MLCLAAFFNGRWCSLLESYKGIVSDLEKIEDIEIEKTPFAGIPEDTLRKALAVLNEFSQELTKKNDLT